MQNPRAAYYIWGNDFPKRRDMDVPVKEIFFKTWR